MSGADNKSETSRVATFAELVRRLCTALVTTEMFPPGHPQAVDTVGRAYDCLSGLLNSTKAPVIISIAGTQILIEGFPLEDKNPVVARFAGKMGELHLTNLYFEPGLTTDEFQRFFAIVGRGARHVNEHGGVLALLNEAKLARVGTRDISYVMVHGDEKIVRRDARVADSDGVNPGDDSGELARYVSNELLRKAEDQKWLIEEMKNNPHGVAETIARGIGIAASQLSFDQGKSESAMDLLLANVRRIGESLVGPESDESAPDRPTLEQALLNLEKEVRTRSRLLTSDAVAAGFINEVMAIVTSYSDQVRARRLSNEFLKGESGLKRAEQLLRRVTPDGEDTRVFVERIRELLTDRGVPPAEIDKALTAVETQAVARKARKAKPRRRFPEAVADGIAKRIAELGIPSDQRQSVVDSIGSFVEQRVRERAVQVEEESAALLTSLKSRDEFLRNLPWGVLLWDSDGNPSFWNRLATEVLGAHEPPTLTPAVRAILLNHRVPLRDPGILTTLPEPSPAEIALLSHAALLVKDKATLLGVLLEPDAKAAPGEPRG